MAIVALLIALLLPAEAAADGGVVRLKQTQGPFTIALFSAEPLRAGPADLSVLVQGSDGSAILDVDVDLALESPNDGAAVQATASRAQATNKLLQAAIVDLNQAGTWSVRVAVRRGTATLAEVHGELHVDEAQPTLRALWPLLVLPAVVVALFATARWLRGRRRQSTS